MGVSDNKENENAHKLVQKDKIEEDMTHGVEISTWKEKEMLFSLWDFAGKKNNRRKNKIKIKNHFRS